MAFPGTINGLAYTAFADKEPSKGVSPPSATANPTDQTTQHVAPERIELTKLAVSTPDKLIKAADITQEVVDIVADTDVVDAVNPYSNLASQIPLQTINTTTDILTLMHTHEALAKSHIQGDKSGLTQHTSTFLQAAIGTVTGLIDTASDIMTTTDVSGTHKAVSILGMVGTAGVTGMAATMAIASGLKLKNLKEVSSEISPFFDKLDKPTTSPNDKVDAFKKLSDMLVVTQEDRKNALDQIFNDKEPWYKKSTADIVSEKYFPGDKDTKNLLRAILKTPESVSLISINKLAHKFSEVTLSAEEENDFTRFMEDLLKTNLYHTMSSPNVRDNFKKLAKVLYKTGLENEFGRKQNLFKNSFGKNAKTDIDELNGELKESDLSNPVNIPRAKIERIEKVLATAKSGLTSNIRIGYATLIGMALGAIALITAHFISGSVFTLVELGISALAAVISIGVSAYRLHALNKDSSISDANKRLANTSVVGSIALTITTAILTKFVTNTPVTIAIAVAWGLLGAFSLYVWKRTHTPSEDTPQVRTPDSTYGSLEDHASIAIPVPPAAVVDITPPSPDPSPRASPMVSAAAAALEVFANQFPEQVTDTTPPSPSSSLGSERSTKSDPIAIAAQQLTKEAIENALRELLNEETNQATA